MQIRIVYHDDLQLRTGVNVEMIHLDDSATVTSLLSRIGASHPELMSQISSFQLSRSGQPITEDTFLNDGDIIDISVSNTRMV